MKEKNNTVHLTVKGTNKIFPGVQALKNVSMEVKKNEVLGLAGENGAGKSTLLKIIAGVYMPDSGEMVLNNQPFIPANYRDATAHGISMVFQEQNLVENISGYENVFLSHENHFTSFGILNKKEMIERTESYFDRFGLDINPLKPLSIYSFSERQMLEIVRAFIISEIYEVVTPLILLDEPTAALSEQDRELLFNKIREYKDRATFVIISHRLSEIMNMSDRIIVLKDGENVGEVFPSESSERNLHTLMVGRELSEDTYKLREQLDKVGDDEIVRVENLTSKGKFEDVNFALKRGEILGIGGLVAGGKKTLGKTVFGIESFDEGKIFLDGVLIKNVSIKNMMKHKVGYVPAERKGLGIIEYLSVGWNISLPSIMDFKKYNLPIIDSKRENEIIDEYISKFRIKAKKSDLCYSLSGGNQQKVVLAKWIAKNLDVLILDNPTRGIDVGAKEEIYSLIRELTASGLSIILITDDLLELIGISNRIIIMKDGKVQGETFAGKDSKPSEEELVKYMV